MMDNYFPSPRKIQLTRSEPLNNIKTIHPIRINNSRGQERNSFTTRYISNERNAVPHPPKSVRPKLTVVSPNRKIRLPVESLNDLRRGSGDGESSQHSEDEQGLEKSLMRVPGDGCFTYSTEESDNESAINFHDANGNCLNEFDPNNDDIFGEEIFEDEFMENETDLSEESTDIIPTAESSQLSTFKDDFERWCSIKSSPSLRLQTSKGSLDDDAPLPLLQSLFSDKPPTLYFTVEGEKVSSLPPEIRRILKWKSSTVTPKVVKASLARTGFRITKKNADWLGVWGKHMKSPGFKTIKAYQKFNHFPGTFHIGRKDKLWKSFSKMRTLHGRKEFNFLPQTFVLPHDINNLRKTWDESVGNCKWIIKPPASARGCGIKVIHKWNQIPKKRPVVVQKYLAKPYLINGKKFDLRIYVYVSCYDPLRVYVFKEGLTRFATSKYSTSSKCLSNKYMHLTNYSINKKNTSVYTTTDDVSSTDAHKWNLKTLWSYLRQQGVNTKKLWESIKDICVKAVLCGECAVNTALKQNVKSRHSCHELFGLDILLDSHLKPWLLEVNISPSLHSSSELDKTIKEQLIKDIFNIAGFYLPKSLMRNLSGKSSNIEEYGADNYWSDHRSLSTDEKAKHTFYLRKHQDTRLRSSILDVLTPDDVLVLMETEDELSRCGLFERLLPTAQSKPYLQFFETPRYYNILLDEWTKQYMRDTYRPSIGVSLLQSLASKAVHLCNDNQVDPHHQWSLCHTTKVKMNSSSVSTSIRSPVSSLPIIRKKKPNYMCRTYSNQSTRGPLTSSVPKNLIWVKPTKRDIRGPSYD